MKAQPPQPQHPQQQDHQPQPGTYYVDIPALPTPQQQIQMAPAIIQGTPIDQNNAELARADIDLMEGMRIKGQATQEQVSMARQRYFNVRLCHAPVLANLGVGVAVAVQKMQNTINQKFNAVNQRLDSMNARLDNVRRRAENLASISLPYDTNAQLVPLVKEKPGVGPVLPGDFEPIVIDHPVARVGDPIGQHFPPNVEDLDGLSHAEINFLSQMHNNSFGIVDADDIEAWRRKFEGYIRRG